MTAPAALPDFPRARAARALDGDPMAVAVRELAPLLGADLAWQDRALCAETDPEAFYPEKGGSSLAAKRVCRACDVRAECLAWALEHQERFGVWGGLSERERRAMKSQRVNQPGRAA